MKDDNCDENLKEMYLAYVPDGAHAGYLEYLAQEAITALVKIFGREIAQEKVANMLLVAFKETGR